MRSLCGLFLALLISSCALEEGYDRFAVVYGISEYADNTDGTVPDLRYCDEDAEEVGALLESQGYQVARRIDGEATWSQLKTDLRLVRDQATDDDIFLFYFSGHGGQNQTLPGKGGEPAEGDSPTEVIYLTQNGELYALDDDKLSNLIGDIPARMRIVLLDACNSGGFIGNTHETDRIPADYDDEKEGLVDTFEQSLILYNNIGGGSSDIPPEKAIVIGASGERELTYEQDSLRHGLFTYFLLESAQEGDTNQDGFVTTLEAYTYIREGIEKNWNVISPLSDRFEPRISGGPLDFILFDSS